MRLQEVAARKAAARGAAAAIKLEISARNPRKLKRGASANKSGKAGVSAVSSPRSPTIGTSVFTAWPLVVGGVQYAAVVRTHS
jgi:hypothetical protein